VAAFFEKAAQKLLRNWAGGVETSAPQFFGFFL
jgi:hypothetical protein